MAERCGPDFVSVLRQPFALTLYAFLQLRDRDRVARLIERDRDVRLGVFMAMAMNDPKQLDRERNDVMVDMKTAPSISTRALLNADVRAAGLALAERIERTGVLVDSPARV